MKHEFAWDELELLWNANNFGAVHDWLGERWNHLIQSRPAGHDDPDAQFLQGLAFAALAFHFTQNHNQDGAALLADDALALLPQFVPAYRGVAVAPVLETLGIRIRDDYAITGSSRTDILLGSDWMPPSFGVRRTFGGFGDDLLFGGESAATEIFDGQGRDLILGGAENNAYQGGAGRVTPVNSWKRQDPKGLASGVLCRHPSGLLRYLA